MFKKLNFMFVFLFTINCFNYTPIFSDYLDIYLNDAEIEAYKQQNSFSDIQKTTEPSGALFDSQLEQQSENLGDKIKTSEETKINSESVLMNGEILNQVNQGIGVLYNFQMTQTGSENDSKTNNNDGISEESIGEFGSISGTDEEISGKIVTIKPFINTRFDENGKVNLSSVFPFRTYRENNSMTFCSYDTYLYISKVTGLKNIPRGDAIDLWAQYTDLVNYDSVKENPEKFISALDESYNKNDNTVFDIIAFKEAKYKEIAYQGHRFTILKGDDDKRYVVDGVRIVSKNKLSLDEYREQYLKNNEQLKIIGEYKVKIDSKQFIKQIKGDLIKYSKDGSVQKNDIDSLHTNKEIELSSDDEHLSITLPGDLEIDTKSTNKLELEKFGINIEESQLDEAVDLKALKLTKDVLIKLNSDQIDSAFSYSFEFGIEGEHLIFSKPVIINFDVDEGMEGAVVDLKVQHEGESDPGIVGLTANPEANCNQNGSVSSVDQIDSVKVLNHKITFYTCGASTFTFSYFPSFFGDGSLGNPFTSLYAASGVTTTGTYYFNLSGKSFDSIVIPGGWLLVASENNLNGTGVVYGIVTGMTLQSDKIISSGVTSQFDLSQLMINETNSGWSVTTTNPTVLTNFRNYAPVHRGLLDNAAWTGAAAIMTSFVGATCNTAVPRLNNAIVQLCGNANGAYWIPGSSATLKFNQAQIRPFNLWARNTNYTPPILSGYVFNDYIYTHQNTATTLQIVKSGNISAISGNIIFTGIVGPSNGNITYNNQGLITYTPNIGFCGTDNFNYKILYKSGFISNTGSIQVYVPCENTYNDCKEIDSVSLAQYNTCAITSSGSTKCRGYETAAYPAIGDGGSTSKSVPTQTIGLTSGIFEIAMNYRSSVAISNSGIGKSWGYNANRQLGDNTNVVKSTPVGIVSGNNIFDLSSSSLSQTFCGIFNNGAAKCWGEGANYIIRQNTAADTGIPIDVFTGIGMIKKVQAGSAFACALTFSGTVRCQGSDANGMRGDGTPVTASNALPTQVTGINNAISLSVGNTHSCVLLNNGTAKCRGANTNGALGNGNTITQTSPVSTSVLGLTGIMDIQAGNNYTCALTKTGKAYCRGLGTNNQLGGGTALSSTGLVSVNTTLRFSKISVGTLHTCGVTSDGQLACRGRNTYGEIGDGTLINRPTPVLVTGFTTSNSIKSCALVNVAPVAINDNVTIGSTQSSIIKVLNNDFDYNVGDTLSISGFIAGSGGTLTVIGTGIEYTPNSGFCGLDTFKYRVTDGTFLSNTGTVDVLVVCKPVAVDDLLSGTENQIFNFDPTVNDLLVITGTKIINLTGAQNGIMSLSGRNVSYQPSKGFCGTEKINYQLQNEPGTIENSLVSSKTGYRNASVGDWVQITFSEYNSLSTGVTNTVTVGANADIMNASQYARGAVGYTMALGSGSISSYQGFAVPANNYIYAIRFKTQAVKTYTSGSLVKLFNSAYTSGQTIGNQLPGLVSTGVGQDAYYILKGADKNIATNGALGMYQNSNMVAASSLVGSPQSWSRYSPGNTTSVSNLYPYLFKLQGLATSDSSIASYISNTGTISITVNCDKPTALDDTGSVAENTSGLISVLNNDVNLSSGATITGLSQPLSGSVTISGNKVKFVPEPGFCGTTSFTYKIEDDYFYKGNEAAASKLSSSLTNYNSAGTKTWVSITQSEYNDITAMSQVSLYGAANTGLSTLAFGNNTVEPSINSIPVGKLVYAASFQTNGTAAVQLKLYNGYGTGSTGVNLSTGVASVANTRGYFIYKESNIITTTTSYPAAYSLNTFYGYVSPVNSLSRGGNVLTTLTTTRSLRTPFVQYVGQTPTDGSTGTYISNTGVVTITVPCSNLAPVAINDSFSTPNAIPVSLQLTGNDYDPNTGQSFTFTGMSTPSLGTIIMSGGNNRYVPTGTGCGIDNFTYSLVDSSGKLSISPATVSVTVLCPNTSPVAVNDTGTINEDGTGVVYILANDYDPDGDPLYLGPIETFGSPLHGTISFYGTTGILYEPDPDYCGVDNFSYVAYDDFSHSNTGTVQITVTCINDLPTAINDNYYGEPNTGLLISVLSGVASNDIDIDYISGKIINGPYTVSLVLGTLSGTITLYSSGGFLYTPNTGFIGMDSFTYQVTDGSGGMSNIATGYINIQYTPADKLCITAPDFIYSGVIQAHGYDQEISFDTDYFELNDEKASDTGYYTTLEFTDLSGSNANVLSNSNIQVQTTGGLQNISGFPNPNVLLNTGLATYQPGDSIYNFIYRPSGINNNIPGVYGAKLNIKLLIPAYTSIGTYTFTITYTLYNEE